MPAARVSARVASWTWAENMMRSALSQASPHPARFEDSQVQERERLSRIRPALDEIEGDELMEDDDQRVFHLIAGLGNFVPEDALRQKGARPAAEKFRD